MMKRISYYFSVLSPFTYLAGDKLERIAESHGADIEYLPMDIMALFAKTGGVPPKDRHVSRQKYRLMELSRISQLKRKKINLSPKYWPTNPRPASFSILSAPTATGDTGMLVRRILSCCWAEERDIADIQVVKQCLVDAGYNPEIADAESHRAEKIFAQNTSTAVARNVFGSPTYIVDGQVFWGQDRLDHLDTWLGGKLKGL